MAVAFRLTVVGGVQFAEPASADEQKSDGNDNDEDAASYARYAKKDYC